MQQKIQLCGCLPAARLARTGKQQSGSRGACEQIPKLQPRQEAPFPCCRTLCAQPQLPGLAVELVQAEMHGLGILHPAGYKVSLADRCPSSDQLQIGDCLKRWEPPQGKQLATVQEVLHRSSRGRAGVCITICRVIYISYINYPTCNLLTTPGLNITTLVKGKKTAVETSLTIRSQDNDMMICNWENKFFLAMQKSNHTIRTHQS